MTDFDERGFIAGWPLPPERWGDQVTNVPAGRLIANHAAPPGVLMIQNFCNPVWCQSVIRECEKLEGSRHTVGIQSGDGLSREINERRTSDAINVLDLDSDVTGVIRQLFAGIIAQHFNASLDWFERPEILRYREGGEYQVHADSQIWDLENKSWSRVLDRDISILVYLNEEFEGGELYFPNFDFRIKPLRGLVIAFPSDGRYVHSAQPVISGVRYAIVSWAAVKGGPRACPAPPLNAQPVDPRR